MKPNRAPTTSWALRKDAHDYVRTLPDDRIFIWVEGYDVRMSRANARLLARRINECLDATVKK